MQPENNIHTQDQQPNPTNSLVDKKAKKCIKYLVNFVKKNKLAISIIAIIALLIFAIFMLLPVVDAGDTKYVNINTEVRIEKGETARLKINNVSVDIVNFTNDTCPKDMSCFGTDKESVEYKLKVDGKSYATGSETPASGSLYQIDTISSDYQSYSIIKIIKS